MRFFFTVILIGEGVTAWSESDNDHGHTGIHDGSMDQSGQCVEEYCGCDQFRQWEEEIEIWRHYQASK